MKNKFVKGDNMEFNDKIKELREKKGMTQTELGEKVGVSLRTIQNYEAGKSYPKQNHMYDKLAEALDTDVNYLLTRGEHFIAKSSEEFGYRGKKDAEELINSAKALFAGGELTDEDKETVLMALQEAFFEAKRENKKYGNRKREDGHA